MPPRALPQSACARIAWAVDAPARRRLPATRAFPLVHARTTRAERRWRIGKPDLELKAPQHDVPAAGLVAYKYVTLPYLFLADTWMQGIQILPDNPRAVHHCNMAYFQITDQSKKAQSDSSPSPTPSPTASPAAKNSSKE